MSLRTEVETEAVLKVLAAADNIQEARSQMVALATDELIPLDVAAARYNLPAARLRTWISRGHLRVRERIKGPGRGGGKVLISAADVRSLSEHPPKNGRPSRN